MGFFLGLLRRNIKLFSIPQNITGIRPFSAIEIPRKSLFLRIFRHDRSVVSELRKWVEEEGKKVTAPELDGLIRELRKRKRFSDALEVSQWVGKSGLRELQPAYHAVQLDLIGKVHGLSAAENYFNELSEEDKTEKTHGALLNCYARDLSTEKAVSHMAKMKELGFVSNTLNYNCLLSLYTNTGQYEKIPTVLAEMKENGALPNSFSYNIYLNSYGVRSDLKGMEMVLEEMENQPYIAMDWNSYAVVANFYIKAGLREKAIASLKKSEEKLKQGNRTGYNHLISLYGSLGNKDEMLRLWGLEKSSCSKILNRDYQVILGCLVKLGEFDDARELLKEWELSGNTWGPSVVNALVVGYCQKGLVEKAEQMIEDLISKGKDLIPNSWGAVSMGYLDKGESGLAVECMKKALLIHTKNEEWKPKPMVIKRLLCWLGDQGEVEKVEEFVGLLKNVIPVDVDMHHASKKSSI